MPGHYSPCSALPTHCIIPALLTASDSIYLQGNIPPQAIICTWNEFTWMLLPWGYSQCYLWRRPAWCLYTAPCDHSLSPPLFRLHSTCGHFERERPDLMIILLGEEEAEGERGHSGSPRQSAALNDTSRAHIVKSWSLRLLLRCFCRKVNRCTAPRSTSGLSTLRALLSSPPPVHLASGSEFSPRVTICPLPQRHCTMHNIRSTGGGQDSRVIKSLFRSQMCLQGRTLFHFLFSLCNCPSTVYCWYSVAQPGKCGSLQSVNGEKCLLCRWKNTWQLLEDFPQSSMLNGKAQCFLCRNIYS